jgi:hypothetical protein
MPIIKRYECGCIGFVSRGGMEPTLQDREVICLRACDDHSRPYVIARRDSLREKPGVKLTENEIIELFDDIAELVRDGYALRELASAMRAARIV